MSMSRAALPEPLVAVLADELGATRDGFPNWTDKSIQRLESVLTPHAARLACRLSTSGAIGTDGVIRMKIEHSGRLRCVWFDPTTGLFDFAAVDCVDAADGCGLLAFADFTWRGDGPSLGRAAVAQRVAVLLGRAVVQSVDRGVVRIIA
jgi:hypothetical protein